MSLTFIYLFNSYRFFKINKCVHGNVTYIRNLKTSLTLKRKVNKSVKI